MRPFETNGRSSESEVRASCVIATAVPATIAAPRIAAMLLRMDSPFRLNGITRDEIRIRSVRRTAATDQLTTSEPDVIEDCLAQPRVVVAGHRQANLDRRAHR